MKHEKDMMISKLNIFMWPIRNLIKVLSVSYLLIVGMMLVFYFFSHADGVSILGLVPLFGILLIAFVIIIVTIGSFHAYVALLLLRRQEKYLQVNFEEELRGKKLIGSSYEAMYQDKNWFICFGGSYVNVFHKDYIKEISEVTQTKAVKKIVLSTCDGRECDFLLPNMYDKNVGRFKAWCKC